MFLANSRLKPIQDRDFDLENDSRSTLSMKALNNLVLYDASFIES